MNGKYWNILQWCSNICYMFGTILLISPKIAATAITPWCVFIAGNIVLFINFISQRSWAFVCLSVFFFTWDGLMIISRLYGIDFLGFIKPFITLLETYIP